MNKLVERVYSLLPATQVDKNIGAGGFALPRMNNKSRKRLRERLFLSRT